MFQNIETAVTFSGGHFNVKTKRYGSQNYRTTILKHDGNGDILIQMLPWENAMQAQNGHYAVINIMQNAIRT